MTTRTITCALCGNPREVPAMHRCTAREDDDETTPRGVVLSRAAEAVIEYCSIGGGRPLVVGGTVRDALLTHFGLAVPTTSMTLDLELSDALAVERETGSRFAAADVDIEVHDLDNAAVLVNTLRSAGVIVSQTGTRFPVMKANLDGEHFDIAIADVEWSTDEGLAESFGRRDYTVNAIGWDPETYEFIDIYGGINDLVEGVLRHTSERFAEDPLRALRGVQFISRFGFTFADETIRMCRSLSRQYDSIATERIWPEIRRLTQGVHISRALEALHEIDWEHNFPELAAVRDVPQDAGWHPEGPVHVHLGLAGDHAAKDLSVYHDAGDKRVIVVLAAILHDIGKAGQGTQFVTRDDGSIRITSHRHAIYGAHEAENLLRRIGAPRHITDAVTTIIRQHMRANAAAEKPTRSAARRLYRELGATLEMADAWLRVCDADCCGRGTGATRTAAYEWFRLMAEAAAADMYRPLLTGRDLINAGVTPGPVFRQILADAVEAQDDGEFDNAWDAQQWFAARKDTYLADL